MPHTATAITEWLHQGTGARAPPGHDSPPIEEIRAGLWLPFRARDGECTLSLEAPDEAVYFMGNQPDAGRLRWYDRKWLERWMREHSTDPDTRAPLGRHELRRFRPVYDGPFDPRLPSPTPVPPPPRPPPPRPPPAINPAMYARICDLFREQYPDISDDFSDRQLRLELNLRPLAIDAVRRSYEPYHFSMHGDIDLMNLPDGLGVMEHFIAGVLQIIVRDTVPDAVAHVGPYFNTVTLYSPQLGPSGCTWSYESPWRENDPVQIRRVPR